MTAKELSDQLSKKKFKNKKVLIEVDLDIYEVVKVEEGDDYVELILN